MTNFEDWSYERGAIDVICGGTPCQSFSVAGLRKGLSDDRGNLALTFCRMVEQLRPQYFIWENVPGCLSSNGGRDFGSITGAMAQFGYVFGWRVFDAQYFGVPQRRRRVFLVGCASGQPEHIRQILFEPESSRGNSEKGGEARQKFTNNTVKCFAGNQESDVAATLQTTCNDYSRADGFNTVVYECHHADSRVKELGQVCQTVTTKWGTGGNNVPLVSFSSNMSVPDVFENVAPTVKVSGSWGGAPPAVAYGVKTCHTKSNGWGIQENRTHTLDASGSTHTVATEKLVRRLTPIEVERLQGFPDDYTSIPWRGKTAPDSRRYKAMGNSMAVPVMRWLGQRIADLEGGIK
jgi:DNA (cytosine-5)-methyltransferase 1